MRRLLSGPRPAWSRWRRLAVPLAFALALLPAFAAPPTRFYFVQISDTHWGARDGVTLTRRAADAINELPWKIEFVVHTGDMCADVIGDAATVRAGLEAMRRIKAPVYYVPGNHDITNADPEGTSALYQRYFGPLSRRLTVRGVTCLFFYNGPLADGFPVNGYDPMTWLETQLEQAGDRPVLVFQHAPSVGAMLDKPDAAEWSEATRRAWDALLRRHGSIKAVVAGHVHRDELHWEGQIPVYVCSSVARFWDRQPSFRVYEYRDGRLGYWTKYLESGKRSK